VIKTAGIFNAPFSRRIINAYPQKYSKKQYCGATHLNVPCYFNFYNYLATLTFGSALCAFIITVI
jgi:hypothetical protein